jgi:DNA polymerase
MSDTDKEVRRLSSLLAWYREMGVTAAVDDVPTDWRARREQAPGAGFHMPTGAAEPQPTANSPGAKALARSPVVADRPTDRRSAPTPLRESPSVPLPTPSAPMRAFDATARARDTRPAGPIVASDLSALRVALEAFDGCGLKANAKNLCLFRGAERARLMVIGEAPGRDEDLAGKPFVGVAGQLLDRMLAAISLGEADVHITNVVYWRPPGNRPPTQQEALACAPFLARQIELVAPDVVLLLGGAAAKQVLNTDDGIMKLRGRWRSIESGGRSVRCMPSLHPDYLLRAPAAKRQVWKDLLAVQVVMQEAGAGTGVNES